MTSAVQSCHRHDTITGSVDSLLTVLWLTLLLLLLLRGRAGNRGFCSARLLILLTLLQLLLGLLTVRLKKLFLIVDEAAEETLLASLPAEARLVVFPALFGVVDSTSDCTETDDERDEVDEE